MTFHGHCLTRNLPRLMQLAGDVLCRPRFEAREDEKLRRENLALLDDIRDDDGALASRFFEREALAGHPYGRSLLGTEETIARHDADGASRWWSRNVVKENLIVGLAGDIDEASARRLAAEAFGPLADGPAPPPLTLPTPPLPAGRRTILVDKPERTQSQVVIGHAGPPHAAPDWLPLHVGATAFGGTFSSRLMTEVRVKRGWSYGASAQVPRSKFGHAYRMRLAPSLEQAPAALELVQTLWSALVAEGVTDEEVDLATRFLEGRWAFEVDTAEKRLDDRIDTLLYGLPETFYREFPARVRAVGRDAVNDVFRRRLHPQSGVTVVTGTASELEAPLRAVAGEVEVVAWDSY
jgi:zinc protease